MDLKSISLRPKPVRPRKFLGLPSELRIRIYKDVLVEVPKWRKRHKASCCLASRSTKSLERPPFIGECGSFSTIDDRCGCTLRTGLSLLAVNRQIHREAVEIFWSQNTFLFAPASQFVEDVGKNLRPEYRRMLQHVCVLNDMLGAHRSFYDRYVEANNTEVFQSLLTCTGLRTIELGHKLLPKMAHIVHQLCGLPRLLSFSLAVVLSYEVKATGGTVFELEPRMPGYSALPKKSMLWFKTSKEINPIAIYRDEELKECIREYVTNFLEHVRYEIKNIPSYWITETGAARRHEHYTRAARRQRRQNLMTNPSSPWTTFLSSPTTPAEMATLSRYFVLKDGPASKVLKLRDQSDCTVEIMGLPLSGATRARHSRERRIQIQALHEMGKLTVEEEIIRQQIKSRRSEKKEVELVAMQAATLERHARRAEAMEEQKRTAKKAQRDERNAKAEAHLAAQDGRRAERKRLWQPPFTATAVLKAGHNDEAELPLTSRPKRREIPLSSLRRSRKVYKRYE